MVMGYRVRLGKIPKSAQEKYAHLTESPDYEEDGENIFGKGNTAYYPTEHTQLYEVGKYVNYPEHRTPFYNFKLDEEEFDILSKEGLAAIIEEFRNDVFEYYSDLLTAVSSNPVAANAGIIEHMSSYASEWEGKWLKPYYLDESDDHKDGAIVHSWKKEYAIFNLVYIYQTFDWENDFLIISGW
jgi:hypothetical protein